MSELRIAYLEAKYYLNFKSLITIFIVLGFPYVVFLLQYKNYSFQNAYDVFTLFLEGIFSIVFIVFAISISAIKFSEQIENRFINYMSTRTSIKSIILGKLLWISTSTFCILFILIFSIGIFAFYLEPILGLVANNTASSQIYNATNFDEVIGTHSFSEILAISTLLYSVVYAAWVGINGALYASITFLLLLNFKNKYLSIVIPIIYYIGVTMIVTVLGFGQFQPVHSIFPFGLQHQYWWSIFVPFLVLLITVIWLLFNIFSTRKVFQ